MLRYVLIAAFALRTNADTTACAAALADMANPESANVAKNSLAAFTSANVAAAGGARAASMLFSAFVSGAASPETIRDKLGGGGAWRRWVEAVELAQLQRLFSQHTKETGLMDRRDFDQWLIHLGLPNAYVRERLFETFDRSNDRFIDFEEFVVRRTHHLVPLHCLALHPCLAGGVAHDRDGR